MNSSSLRCKSQIIQELEGALNSHHVSNNSNALKALVSDPINKEFESKIDKFFKLSSSSDKKAPQLKQNTTVENSPPGKGRGRPKKIKDKNDSNELPLKKTQKKRKISLRKETVLSRHRTKHQKNNNEDDDDDEENDKGDEETGNEPSPCKDSPSKDVLAPEQGNNSSSVNIHKESLILFDEIDIVFKEDVGFWAAINYFVKKSKKPIVLTTNDEFLLEKINLNIERIDFVRPRVDAAIRFLKSVVKRENSKLELENATAYKIINECRCDMRRALVQLQTLIGNRNEANVDQNKFSSSLLEKYNLNALNGTIGLNQMMIKSLFVKCPQHNQDAYFESIFYLDGLNKKLLTYSYMENNANLSNFESPVSLKPYDQVLLKDGLTDNSTNIMPFNPFQTGQINFNNKNTNYELEDTHR